MATLGIQQIARAALNPTFTSASGGGDDFLNDGKQFVVLKNTDASSRTVTFVTTFTVDGRAVEDLAIAVPAATTIYVGPFKTTYYNDTNGKLGMTYSATTNLSLAILELSAT